MAKWWRKRALRIYHPNPRECELRDLDVGRFVADCILTEAEAIVVSVGGIYAFYPSQVPYHHVSTTIGDRDLVGEIVTEAHTRGLRVIARVDFSKARENVYQEHPEWFQVNADGSPAKAGAYYRACPLGGYQRDAFALPVLREIQTRYSVDGYHLNAGGYGGFCYCPNCQQAFANAFEGATLPRTPADDAEAWQRFLHWREEIIGQHLALLYAAMQEQNAEAFFMAELAGPQNPSWALNSAHHLPSLARSCSQLLLTAGEVSAGRISRDWVGLACKQARAVRRKRAPIINIKMQMRELDYPHALMPPAEFAFHAYQAMMHGAGLKTPTFGLPHNQADPRTMPALADVFRFMRQQQAVLDSMLPIEQVALVWPERALRAETTSACAPTEGLRREALGLYEALRARHMLFGLLYDEKLDAKSLGRFNAIVLPTATQLAPEQVMALGEYTRAGGLVIVFDCLDPHGGLFPLPEGWDGMLGGEWSQCTGASRYGLPDVTNAPHSLARLGPLALTRPYRRVKPPDHAQTWLWASQSHDIVIPEDLGAPEKGEDSLVWVAPLGEGFVAYVAVGLGTMIRDLQLPEYAALLDALLCQSSLCRSLLTTDAPGSVEVTMAQWQEGVVVHLLNGSGTAPLDRPTPIGPITLDIAWDGPALAQLCMPGASPRTLRCEDHWNRIQVVVPRLDLYAQVVVRTA